MHRVIFLVAVMFSALAGKGDDAVGIVHVDAGTNGVVETAMPFDAVPYGGAEASCGPASFISGLFLGDGSIFSDRLYRFPLSTNDYSLTTNDYPLSTNDYAFYSDGAWLDSETLSNSTMTASSGDTLYLLRTDNEPFSFYLHGRIPSLSSVPSSPFPVFTHISVDPAETNAVVAMETDRAADLFFAQSQTNTPLPSDWSYLGRHLASLSFLYPLASPPTANDYPLTAFLVSDATRDTDGDGLPDAMEELVYGTDPLLADTDGDGVSDTLEIAWGRDPLVSGPAPLTLFSEPFEAPEVQPGALDGQHGWNAPTGAVVQTERVHSGAAALMIEAGTNETVAATHSITSSLPRSETWLDCRVSAGSCDDIGFPPDDGSFVAFSFDISGHPVMLDGETVVTNTSVQVPLYESFRRVTMRLDFAAARWDIYVDGVLAGENLSMRGENPSLNAVTFIGNSGFVDDIAVATSRPEGLSSDGDRMADEWEMAHFGGLSRDGTLDFDSDGLSDADEYLHGADPKTGDTDSDGIPDLWEVQNGLSPADPADAALDPDGDGLANTEEFQKGGDPNFSEPDPTLRMPGLLAEYWRTPSNLQTLPDYGALMPSHVSVSPVIDHPAVPWLHEGTIAGDRFAARYSGFIRIDETATYTFFLSSDDGSALFIDGVAVASDPEPHSARTSSGTATLCAGWHSVEIRYYENTGSETLKLEWASPSITRENVPETAFCHIPCAATPAGFAPGLSASFYAFGSSLSSLPDFSLSEPLDVRVVPAIDEPATDGAWSSAPTNLLDRFGAVFEGWLLVPRSGDWNIELSSDDGSRLYIDGAPAIDHDEAHSMSAKTAALRLSEGLHSVKVEYFENTGSAGLRLSWAMPGFPTEPVPARYFCRNVSASLDTDGDGVPDWWEEKHGLDPSDPADAALDADADGLSNLAEFLAGTDPRLSDTDGDGMPDGWETRHGLCAFVAEAALDDPDGDGLVNLEEARFGTDPNLADTDGDGADDFMEIRNSRGDPLSADIAWPPVPAGSAVAGAAFTSSTGTWRTDAGGVVFAEERSGSLAWRLSVPEGGADALAVRIGQHKEYSGIFEFDLALEIDGVFISRMRVPVSCGTPGEAFFFLPEIAPGEHDFRIVWRNWEEGTSLAVHDLRFVMFGGPDSDGDGVADWKRRRAEASCSIEDLPAESLVSPLCVEGRDLWRDALKLSVGYSDTNAEYAVVKTVGDGFYADIPLPADGTATVSMLNRPLADSFSVFWRAFDVFGGEYATNALVIRAGDSLKIAPGFGEESDVAVFRADAAGSWTAVTNWTETAAVPYLFGEAGLYLVSVTAYDALFSQTNAFALVDVVDSRFPIRNPALLMGRGQTLSCPGISPRCVLEHDAELQASASVASGGGVELTMLTNADRDLGLVSRLYDGGPVCDAVQVSPIWADNGDYYDTSEAVQDGFRYVELALLLGSFPEGTSVVLEIFVSGVTFDDGTRTKTLTASDFDSDGYCKVRFIKAKNVTTSVCHRTYIYQNGKLIYTNKDEVQ